MSLADPLIYDPIPSPVLKQITPRSAQDKAIKAGHAPTTRLREIIELGKRALQRKECADLAFDLLGLDGVSFPIAPSRERSQKRM